MSSEELEKVDGEGVEFEVEDGDELELQLEEEALLEQESHVTHPETRTGRPPIRSTIKRKCKKAFRKMHIMHAMTSKISVENKVGKPVVDLDIDDPLRIIALSIQRSLRHYGDNRPKSSGSTKHLLDDAYSEYDESLKTAEDTVQKSFIPQSDDDLTSSIQFDGGRASLRHDNKFKNVQPNFRCRSHSPYLFQEVRKAFGITERQYYATLGLQELRKTSCFRVISKNDASGKSGSFFFFSSDQKFILKSCNKTDFKTLLKILPTYTAYVQNHGSKTLLPRYLGLYELTFPDKEIPSVAMVIMTNFFGGSHKIHCRFDLKGSTYKRFASEKERAKNSPVLKDNDWINENKKLTFPHAGKKEEIEKQLEKDTQFLASKNLIDYSLLVGIHDSKVANGGKARCNRNQVSEEAKTGIILSHDPHSGEIRYFGIVDILTPFRAKKMAETCFTGTLLCRHDISCQPPRKYARRFVRFLSENALDVSEHVDEKIKAVLEEASQELSLCEDI